MPKKLTDRFAKAIGVGLAVLFGVAALAAFLLLVWEMFTPLQDNPPPPPNRAPGMFYVGNHAFRVPQDYSFLKASDYDGPGNEEVIFDFSYPWFTAAQDDLRVKADFGTPKAGDDDVSVFITEHHTGDSSPEKELQDVKAGTTTDWLKPGPYQLIEVHEKDDSTWILTREYIGILDDLEIDFLCGNPAILLNDGTRDDRCVGIYTAGDFNIEEDISVTDLAHWQEIMKKINQFLQRHEVK